MLVIVWRTAAAQLGYVVSLANHLGAELTYLPTLKHVKKRMTLN